MKRFLVLFLWAWVLPFAYSDVVLSDEQAAELDQTLTQLEETLKMQDSEIVNLKVQNEQLQNDSKSKQQQLNEQQKTIDEAKSSYKKQGIFSVLLNILISICSVGVGILIGLIL